MRRFTNGFEMQSVTSGVECSITGSPTIDTSVKRSGSASLNCASGGRYGYNTLATGVSSSYFRIYLRVHAAPSSGEVAVMTIRDSTPRDCANIKLNSALSLELWDSVASAQEGSDSSTLAVDTWYRVELKIEGTTATAYLDGDQFATGTVSCNESMNVFRYGAIDSGTYEVHIDDVAINDNSQTGGQDDLPGPGKLVLALPNAAGDNNPTTGDYSMINEIPPSDTATSGVTMIELDNNSAIGDFGMTSSSDLGIDSTDFIKLVDVRARIREESSGTSNYTLRIKSASGGTVSTSQSVDGGSSTVNTNPSGSTYCSSTLVSYYDPSTNTFWTPTGTNSIDNMQCGVATTDGNPDIWCLWLGAYIEYDSGLTTTEYYFDGSDATVTDASSQWTDDGNAFDSDSTPSTFAYTTVLSTAGLKAEGTNAPTSGENIVGVYAKIYGGSNTYGWGTLNNLKTPDGGWTWEAIAALEGTFTYFNPVSNYYLGCNIYGDGGGGDLLAQPLGSNSSVGIGTCRAYKAVIYVIHEVATEGDKSVDVSDSTAVTDSATVEKNSENIDISDSTTATDAVTVGKNSESIEVGDSTTVTDAVTMAGGCNINVYDETTATDSVTMDKEETPAEINVGDTTAVTDSTTVEKYESYYEINVNDTTTATDAVTTGKDSENISVSDTIAVTDSPTAETYDWSWDINVSDTTTVTDSPAAETYDWSWGINVSDSTTATDAVTMAGECNISVSDGGAGGASWYDSSWGYRVKITALASKVDADLTNFPVYVNLNDLPSEFHTHVNQTDARDIRVTKSDGVSELAREVVFYTAASDTGELWFLADTIDGDTDTDYYIYYGKETASDYAHTDTYGTHAVWADYEGVWHLQSNAAAYDSSPNSYDLTKTNTPLTADARIGGGVDLQSTDKDKFTLIGTSCPNIFMATDQTWQYIVKNHSTSGSPLMKARTDANYQGGMWHAVSTSNVRYNMQGMVFQGTGAMYGDATIDDTSTEFRNLAMVLDISTDIRIYSDGVLKKTDPVTSGTPDTTTTNVYLSIGGLGGYDSYYEDGIVDEVRIKGGLLTATWLSTEYNNQSSPSTFYTVGAEDSGVLVVTDSVTVEKQEPPYEINIGDDTTVTDSASIESPTTYINVSDSTTVTDGVVVESPLIISVYDESTVTDDRTVETTTEIAYREINVGDDTTVTDATTILKNSENIDVSDSTTATDSATVGKNSENIYVDDGSAVTDSATVFSPYLTIDKSDSTTVTDAATVGKNSENIDVTDSTTATDSTTVLIPTLHINVGDDTTVTDSATIETNPKMIYVYDESIVTDSATVGADICAIFVGDDTTATDAVTVGKNSENINVADSTTATDDTTVVQTNLVIDVSDSTTVTDSNTVGKDSENISVSDTTAVTDDTTVLQTQLIISVYDESVVTDGPTLECSSIEILIYAFDTTEVTDAVEILKDNENIEVYDESTVTDAVTVTRGLTAYDGEVPISLMSGVSSSNQTPTGSILDSSGPVLLDDDRPRL